MNRKLTVLVILILALLVSVPSFVCGWLMADRHQDINQTTNVTIGKSEAVIKTNINTATKSELDSLPGVGDCKAYTLIKNRPYSDIYELLEKGILGEDTFNKIKDKITI